MASSPHTKTDFYSLTPNHPSCPVGYGCACGTKAEGVSKICESVVHENSFNVVALTIYVQNSVLKSRVRTGVIL